MSASSVSFCVSVIDSYPINTAAIRRSPPPPILFMKCLVCGVWVTMGLLWVVKYPGAQLYFGMPPGVCTARKKIYKFSLLCNLHVEMMPIIFSQPGTKRFIV